MEFVGGEEAGCPDDLWAARCSFNQQRPDMRPNYIKPSYIRPKARSLLWPSVPIMM